MAYSKSHTLCVAIKCDDQQNQLEAEDRLQGWIETFGYTDSSHGFTFESVGRPIQRKHKQTEKV